MSEKDCIMTLHEAVEAGKLDVVKQLIETGADINEEDKEGETPLHKAAIGGNLDIVKYLVDKGANVNAKNKYDETPFHKATEEGHRDVVKYLVSKGASVKSEGIMKMMEYYRNRKRLNRFNTIFCLVICAIQVFCSYLSVVVIILSD